MSSLEIAVDDADLLVVDPARRETGKRFATGEEVADIPQSGHFEDAIDNDVTGEAATSMTSSVGIRQPAEGTYRIQVRARPPGPKELSIHGFTTDGFPQPVVRIPLHLDSGAVASFSVAVSRTGTVEFKRIGSWTHSGFDTALRTVLRSEAEWSEFWSRLHRGVPQPPERPRVDFGLEVVIGVALGQRPSGGYAIRVEEIRATRSLLSIALTEVSPGANCVVTGELTQAVDVVRVFAAGVPRAEFAVSRQTVDCP